MSSSLLSLIVALAGTPAEPSDLILSADDTKITASCRVVIPPNTVIADANHDGVIHIDADNVTIEFAEGSVLRGAPAGTPWDQLSGCGIRLNGHRGVTLKNLRVHGYKAAIHVTKATKFIVDSVDLSDNYRQRLRSTPAAEDAADWLFPHNNDANEWLTQHGAALYVEDSETVSISNVTVRRTQNGIVLDRVTAARVFDNDCSFLSGWGLAMWRTSRCTISRNAFDFCVRGYSHGVYNRGQDSAGILVFEQCSRNVFAENSATHGGDGFFGFAGREALGEAPKPNPEFTYERRGCNDNIIIGNDFSDAVAHGVELTFSHGNKIVENILRDCGICGVWGGYSQGTLIAKNIIERNGRMAHGLERGGINMEHASRNIITDNAFRENACAVHLWWDDDAELLKKPGVAANGSDVTGNIIARNTFDGDTLALQLRDTQGGHLKSNYYVENIPKNMDKQFEAPRGQEPELDGQGPTFVAPKYEAFGSRKPVGARAALAGREHIIMDEWGPWDHERPAIRYRGRAGASVEFELLGVGAWEGASSATGTFEYNATGNNKELSFSVATEPPAKIDVVTGSPTIVRIAGGPGVWSYDVQARTPNEPARRWKAAVITAEWNLKTFPWTDAADPRTNLEAWRALAAGPAAVHATLPALDCRFGSKGPRDLKWSEEVTARGPGADHFGIRASTKARFPKGAWRAVTTSDDGIRVLVNSKPVIENWTWHGPTRNEGQFESDGADSTVEVEYFEIGGHAILTLDFEPIPTPNSKPTP